MKATSPYGRAKKKQRIYFIVLLATFFVVATTVGPLSNRYSSALLTVASIVVIVVFVLCMILLGSLGLRCPQCGTRHGLATMATPPKHCSNCGSDLSSWYD